MRQPNREWDNQGGMWLAAAILGIVVWGRDMSPPLAISVFLGPALLGLLLLLRVRWAPEFLIALTALFSAVTTVLGFEKGFTKTRILILLLLGPGVIYPYLALRASRPGGPKPAGESR